MIQIDIDLPETCGDCPMKEIYHKAYYCGLIDDFIRGYKRYQERDKRCPLREPKTGHWIGIDEEPHEDYECDKCGYVVSAYTANIEPHTEYKYCPNCGVKMEEVEE